MAQVFYCEVAGQLLGPFEPADLKRMAKSGDLNPTDKIRQGSSGKWVEARKAKGIFDRPASPVEPTPVAPPSPDGDRASPATPDDDAIASWLGTPPALEAQSPVSPAADLSSSDYNGSDSFDNSLSNDVGRPVAPHAMPGPFDPRHLAPAVGTPPMAMRTVGPQASALQSTSARSVAMTQRAYPHNLFILVSLVTCGWFLPVYLLHYIFTRDKYAPASTHGAHAAGYAPADSAYTGLTLSHHVSKAQKELLLPGEKLEAIVHGRVKEFSTKRDGFFKIVYDGDTTKGGTAVTHYLVVTDRRVIFWARGLFKRSTDAFQFEDIGSVEYQEGLLYAGIVLNIHGKTENFTAMRKRDAKHVVSLVRGRILALNRASAPATLVAVAAPAADPVAQLQALASLFEKGLIAKQDFEAKKKSLLDRI